MTSATSMRETAELTTAMMNNLDELPPTEAPATTTTAARTGLDLDRDSLSEIFSHLRDPQDLATVPCVCRHWRRAAEEGGEEGERLWRAVAESLGLGLGEEEKEEVEEGEGEEEEEEKEVVVAAAVAATLDRRALRSGARLLPAGPPSSTWRARVRAAWPELCFECRLPDSGRRRPQQAATAKGGGEGAARNSPCPPPPPRTLSLRHCHGCSSTSADRQRKTRLVDAAAALRILRRGGEGDDDDDVDSGDGEEEQGPKSSNAERLLLLLARLPRSLDVRPQDPTFRTVELFRRSDVRALALGFEKDIYL